MFGLVRHSVFFVIQLKTRRVEIAGITHDPDGPWMLQVAAGRPELDGLLRGLPP